MAYTLAHTASQWLQVIEQHANHAGDGTWLEDMVCDIGPSIPDWDLKSVFHWRTWPDREHYFPGAKSPDPSIDNVGIRLDGSLVAIQCKVRSENTKLTYDELAKFAGHSGNSKWAELWFVSNVQFGRNVDEFNRINEERPLKLVDFVGPVKELALEESLGVREDDELTAMQDEVVNSVLKNLPLHANHGRECWNEGEARGHIVLPCGTGKTRIAYRISKNITEQNNMNGGGGDRGCTRPLDRFGLANQARIPETCSRDRITIRTLAICSDVSSGRTQRNDPKIEERVNLAADPTKDVSQLRAYEVVGDTATNEQQVIDWLNNFHGKTEANFLALFSTYQSSHNTAKGLRELGLKADLLICDEAHRTAGIKKIPKNGERLRNFTLCHDKDQFPATFRIYQTATPKVYTNVSNKQVLLDADDAGWDVRSMNDPSTFGAEFID